MNWNCVAQRLEGVAQAVLAKLEGHQFDVGAEQVLVRGDHAEVLELGGERRLLGRDLAHDDLVGAVAVGIAEEAEAAGGVGLRVAVDQQRAGAERGERCREVDGGRGLADSALLVGDCDRCVPWRGRVKSKLRTWGGESAMTYGHARGSFRWKSCARLGRDGGRC